MAGIDFDLDAFDEAVENAPTAGYGPNVSFGKCTIIPQIMAWDRKKGEKAKPNPRPFVKGEKVNKDKGEYPQVEIIVDVPELNPQLANPYKRRVDVKMSNRTGSKPVLTDWDETVLPSLIAVVGDDWKKVLGKGAYVQVEDTETVEVDKEGNKKGFESQTGVWRVNTAPKFVALYKSKAECEAARAQRFASRNGASDDGATEDVPLSVIKQVQGLNKATKGNLDQIREILADKPYGEYEVEALLAAAGLVE